MSDMAATEGSVQQAGAQGAEGASQTEGQQQATEAPLDPRVMDHLNKLGSQVGELGQMFESFAPALEQMAQGQQGQQADPFAEFGGEEFMSGLGEQVGMDPQQLQENLRNMVQAEAQRMIGQHVQPIQEELRHQAFVKLEDSYPDLKDPEKAASVLDKSEQMAAEFAQATGLPPQMVPAMALNPAFVELVYKAEMADQRALAQSATGEQQEVQLEGGSAGAPAAQEPSLGERLAGAGPSGVSPDGNFRWW